MSSYYPINFPPASLCGGLGAACRRVGGLHLLHLRSPSLLTQRPGPAARPPPPPSAAAPTPVPGTAFAWSPLRPSGSGIWAPDSLSPGGGAGCGEGVSVTDFTGGEKGEGGGRRKEEEEERRKERGRKEEGGGKTEEGGRREERGGTSEEEGGRREEGGGRRKEVGKRVEGGRKEKGKRKEGERR